MNSGDSTIPRDDWLEHASALRRLAASLVGDENDADDLVQDTWLRANDSRIDESGRASDEQPMRGPWLRTVLRNLVRDRSRERARRAWSERNVAREEALPSASEVTERLDVAQRVAREVARLDEPYRTAIHLRYFEGLSPEEIAHRSHVPLETVRTRLRRGLAQLRERMDRAYGGKREAWSVALGALACRSKPALVASSAASVALVGGVLMSTKVVLTATAIVIAAVSLFVWQRSNGEPRIDGSTPAIEKVSESKLSQHKPAALDDTSSEKPADARVSAAAPAAPTTDNATIEVNGTVVITDENGAERKDESGTLGIVTASSESDPDAKRFEVHFEHGRWSTRIPRDNFLVFGALTANKREAILPQPKPIKPDGSPIVVHGQWTKRGRLRVIDAVTKEDLSDVEARCCDRGWRANPQWTHPGDDERVHPVIEHVASPFDLPERTWLTPYWVHAPHHAWSRIDFDHKVGGMRTIELSPSPSSAIVSIDGDLPNGALVRLYPMESPRMTLSNGSIMQLGPSDPERMPSWLAAVAVHASAALPARIDDLQAGKFLATVEVGEYEEKLRIGSAPIEVNAGETARVTVPIDASLLAVPRTHLFGTIEVPDDLDRGACSLKLSRLDGGEKSFSQRLIEMSFTNGDRNVVHWDAGRMRTGDYVANLTSIQHNEIVHAPGPGETKLALVIPKLSTVKVEVVDAATGASVETERLQWTRGSVKGIPGSVIAPIMPNLKSRQLEFVAPHGEVELSCAAKGYEETSKKFTLARDAEVCRLELAHATAIHFALREGDAALDVGLTFFGGVKLQRDGREVQARRGRATGSETTWFLDEPGRYEITFLSPPGFEPLQPRSVDVVTGKTVDVIVQMKRTH